jgi:hypothetical protein
MGFPPNVNLAALATWRCFGSLNVLVHDVDAKNVVIAEAGAIGPEP